MYLKLSSVGGSNFCTNALDMKNAIIREASNIAKGNLMLNFVEISYLRDLLRNGKLNTKYYVSKFLR